MKRISQFNTFPFEDQVRFHETKGVVLGCQHEFNEWTSWQAVENTGWKRYGSHCKKCPQWACLAEEDVNPSFKYIIEKVVTGGIRLKLTYNVTGEVKEFFIAGLHAPCPLEMHMRNMTNDLMLSWFVKQRPKKGKKK